MESKTIFILKDFTSGIRFQHFCSFILFVSIFFFPLQILLPLSIFSIVALLAQFVYLFLLVIIFLVLVSYLIYIIMNVLLVYSLQSFIPRIPWFHYPIIYDIRSKPRKIISPTGSKGVT